jgi:hypothetical protein
MHITQHNGKRRNEQEKYGVCLKCAHDMLFCQFWLVWLNVESVLTCHRYRAEERPPLSAAPS